MMKKLYWLFGLAVAALVAACGGTATAPTSAPAVTPGAPAATTAAMPLGPGAGIVKGPFEGEAKALNGAGATFPAVLYSKWFNEYEKVTGVKVNYQAVGSGGGIKAIQDMTVDFGASDGPMSADQEKAAKGGAILHVPMALGAVVATYNVPEAKSPLKFSGETLAGIFLGTITKWNDPKLVADNPDLANVKQEIITLNRADDSGSTVIWTDYLSNVSADWKSKVGAATSVNWPAGLGGQGNPGVAGEVKNNAYAIGYVELIYALQNKLAYGQVKNKAGKFITPSIDSVTAAAAGVAQTITPDLKASIVNTDGDAAYPISGFTWLLIYQKQPDKAKGIALARLAWWAIYDAQKYNAALGYAPLPAGIAEKAADMIKTIKLPDGSAAFDHDGLARYTRESFEPAGDAVIDAWRAASASPEYGGLNATVDYTYQVARGSGSDPQQTRTALLGGTLFVGAGPRLSRAAGLEGRGDGDVLADEIDVEAGSVAEAVAVSRDLRIAVLELVEDRLEITRPVARLVGLLELGRFDLDPRDLVLVLQSPPVNATLGTPNNYTLTIRDVQVCPRFVSSSRDNAPRPLRLCSPFSRHPASASTNQCALPQTHRPGFERGLSPMFSRDRATACNRKSGCGRGRGPPWSVRRRPLAAGSGQ